MSIQGKEENTERVLPSYLPMPDLNLTPEENELQINSQEIIVYTRRARAVEEVTPVSDRNICRRLNNEENNAEETNYSDATVPQSPPSENVCPEVEKITEEGGNEDAGNEDAHEDLTH